MFDLIYILGIMASSISGALKGGKHNLDIFGVVVIGVITGLGGGMLRDTLLGVMPYAIRNEYVMYYCIAASVIAYIFTPKVKNYIKLVKIFDALGLAVFVVIGADKAMTFELGLLSIAIMGTLTGVAGGFLRDVMVREIPYVLKEDIYALLCMLGGVFYYFALKFLPFEKVVVSYITIFTIFTVRMLVIKYKIKLPRKVL